MRPIAVCLLAAPLLSGCFMPASVENRARNAGAAARRAEVADELELVRTALGARGWHPAADPREGVIEVAYEEYDGVRFTLPSTGEFALVGVCDGNCTDMDLVVWDQEEQRVGFDRDPDARPMVQFSARSGARYEATVTIPGCDERLCLYAVQLFTR